MKILLSKTWQNPLGCFVAKQDLASVEQECTRASEPRLDGTISSCTHSNF